MRTVDARNLDAMTGLIRELDAGLVLNVASSYCNQTILDACLETGANYLDTALAEDEFVENIEPPWYSYVEWPRRPKFAERKISALLGMGFDPGRQGLEDHPAALALDGRLLAAGRHAPGLFHGP